MPPVLANEPRGPETFEDGRERREARRHNICNSAL